MDERVVRFRVGLMVLGTLLITGILVALFGEMPKFFSGKYTIHVVFDQAPGVTVNTPVRKSGILIGRVTNVEFAKDDSGRETTRVLVTAEIQGDKKLYEDEVCYVQSTLLGDAALEFIRSPKLKQKEPLRNGAYLEGVYVPDPAQLIRSLQGSLATTIDSVTGASKDLSVAAGTLNVTLQKVNAIVDENQAGLKTAIDQAGKTLASVKQTADIANNILGDEESQRQIRESLRRMPEIVEETRQTVRGMRQTMSLMDRNLTNVEKFTARMGNAEFLDHLDRGAQNLDRLIAQLAEFSENLNNPNGSLGRLASDPELYQHLSRAARNVDELTRQLKPVVEDARVLSDKMARHPGVILRDAVRPGAGIK